MGHSVLRTMEEIEGEWGGRWLYDPRALLGPPGGFGVVHPGQSADRTPVAVKVVNVVGRSERLMERELEIATKLRDNPSDHLIEIFDVARAEGTIFLVMEQADGSLAEEIESLVGDVPQVIAVLREVGLGLQELHGLPVIHRDLKPGNVLRVGQMWKLSDFGIARDASIGTQTETFVGAGTWAYMAPELWDNQSPTFKSDLYAIGCMAFEVLIGHPPFDGPDRSSYERQHRTGDVPALPEEIDAAFRTLVLRLLNKDPAARPQDARALVERLEAVRPQPLGGLERKLREQAHRFEEERSARSNALALAQHRYQQERELMTQAASDLEEFLGRVAARLQAALPDVRLRAAGDAWVLGDDDASLSIEVWPDVRLPEPDEDPLLIAGAVRGANRNANESAILANVAFEAQGERIVWKVYRFGIGPLVPPGSYPYGPPDRSHGLEREVFLDPRSRQIMRQRATNVWQCTLFGDLEENHFMSLFIEAQALPALPDWSS